MVPIGYVKLFSIISSINIILNYRKNKNFYFNFKGFPFIISFYNKVIVLRTNKSKFEFTIMKVVFSFVFLFN
jgi:hypothetical protein